MVKVCEICGDAGFADLLSICDQCEAAEHLYCMLTLPESDGEACWSCEKCKLKQETIRQEMGVSSLHPEAKQSQEKFSKRRREDPNSLPVTEKQAIEGSNGSDSSPASKKQALEASNGTDYPSANKQQDLESSDGTKSLAASKKKALESSNTDSLPFSKKKALRHSNGVESLPFSKKQAIEISNGRHSNGIESLPTSKKQAIESSNGINFPTNSMNQTLESCNDSDSLSPSKRQALKSYNGTNSVPASKRQAIRSSNGTNSLPVSKKQAVESCNGTDSLPASKKQAFESSNGSDSLPVSRKQVYRSSNGESLLQTDSSLVDLEASRAESYGGSRQKGSSLQSDVPLKILETGELVCGNATSLGVSSSSLPHLSKENSVNRSVSRQSPLSMAQMIPDLMSAGSKNTMLHKSRDCSKPYASELAQRSLGSSKGINSGSGRSSLHRKSSESKVIVECKKEHKELVPAGSMKGWESIKDSPKLTKQVAEKHDLSEIPDALLSLEVDREDGRSLLPKGNSSSLLSKNFLKLDKNEYKEHIPGNDDIKRCKSVIGLSILAGQNNTGNQEEVLTKNTLSCLPDTVVPSFNEINTGENTRMLPNGTKADIGHSMINSSEINVPSSSAMENRLFNTCERGDMAGSLPSHANNSSGIPLPHQKQLAIPQSKILWKGAFKAVDIAYGSFIFDGIQAHPSTTASPKVYEMTKKFDSQLHLEKVNRVDTWPKRFVQSPPTDDTIGLYFFPEEGKGEESYAKLVEDINKYDLSMRMRLDGAELLIYSSVQLPKYVQRIFGKFYLWGVFRRAEKSTTDHKAEGTSTPHDHVRADMVDSFAPSRSNSNDSVPRMVRIPNAHKNCVKEETDFIMEGERDFDMSERPLRSLDSLKVGPSKVSSEYGSKEVSIRSSVKPIDWSHERNPRNDTDKEPDGRSVSNSSAPHVLHRNNTGKSHETMHERSYVHRNHQIVHKEELNLRFGASNSSSILEEKGDLLKLGPQAENRKPGFVSSSRLIDCNPWPSSSDHLREKRGFKHFQAEPDSKAEAKKQIDSRGHCLNFSSRKSGSYRNQADGCHNSHLSSLSSGESDSSYGNKGGSLSQPLAHRKIPSSEYENKFNRSQSFREDQNNTRNRREMEERNRRYEASNLGLERHREKSHRHWRTKDGRRPIQMDNYRRNPVINNRDNYFDSYLHKSYMHEEMPMHKDSSSDRQIHVKNFVKEKDDTDNNFRSSKHGISSIKRAEGEMSLLDVKEDWSIIRSGEASADQHQHAKDQWSFTQLHNVIDEAAENNTVSEISNAASTPESLGQIYSGENVSPRILEADFAVIENSRTEHTSGSELDQNHLASHGNWYAGSSPGQTDLEPVECLELFPLEEENLGMTKNVVNDWDIDLDLGLGRSSLKNVLKMTDRQVCSNKSNLDGPDASPRLGISVPTVKTEI